MKTYKGYLKSNAMNTVNTKCKNSFPKPFSCNDNGDYYAVARSFRKY